MLYKERIITAENALLDAIKNGNVEVIESLLHHDLLFIIPSGEIITKEQDLASHKAGMMRVDKLESTIERINIMEDAAVSVVVYETEGVMLRTPIAGRFRYIRVWKSFTTGIKVIAGSCFKIS